MSKDKELVQSGVWQWRQLVQTARGWQWIDKIGINRPASGPGVSNISRIEWPYGQRDHQLLRQSTAEQLLAEVWHEYDNNNLALDADIAIKIYKFLYLEEQGAGMARPSIFERDPDMDGMATPKGPEPGTPTK